jgi:hypothetical protein
VFSSRLICLFIYLVELSFFNIDFFIQFSLPIMTTFLILIPLVKHAKIQVTTIPAAIILSTGLIGYIISESKNSTIGTSINLILPTELQKLTLGIFCLAASSLAIGSYLFFHTEKNTETKIESQGYLQNRYIGLIGLVPILLMLIGFNTSEFFYRENHLLTTQVPILARLGSALSLVIVPVIALWSTQQSSRFRILAYVEIFLYTVLFISTSSRSLVVIPISVLIIVFLQNDRKGKFLVSILIMPVLYISLAIPLFLRSLGAEGLFPYLKALKDFRLTSTSSTEIFQNFTISFDLNGLVAFKQTKFPKKDLLIELSPLLGDQAGWYEISGYHRLNMSTPSPAIGEAANYGAITLVLVFIMVGAIFSFLFGRSMDLSKTMSFTVRSFLLASSAYFGVLCLQYNLRSATRVVYYSIAVVALVFFLSKKHDEEVMA